MKVLIAEDDPISRKILEMTLARWGYEVIVTCDGREAISSLNSSDLPKLAVLDWMMPEKDGLDVCRHIRDMENGEYVYIILLTAKGTKEDIISGLEAGADDYVVKPFDKRELEVRIRCGERIVKLQQAILTAQEALREQATHDSLTGLLNRAAIYEALDREGARLRREDRPLSVIMADLDHFKKINDTHGHAAGDAVLRKTAIRMHADARSYDFIGRYGGEEFLIILPETPHDKAVIIADRIRKRISSQPFRAGTATFPITISMGVASTDLLGSVSMDRLVHAADDALYQAKDHGRDRVETALAPSRC